MGEKDVEDDPQENLGCGGRSLVPSIPGWAGFPMATGIEPTGC